MRTNIGVFVLGVLLAVLGGLGERNYTHNKLVQTLELHNCTDLGMPKDSAPQDIKETFGHGYSCPDFGTVIVLPKGY